MGVAAQGDCQADKDYSWLQPVSRLCSVAGAGLQCSVWLSTGEEGNTDWNSGSYLHSL